MGIWLAFSVGIGDFSSREKKTKDYIIETNRRLKLLRTPTRVIDAHSSGNFVVETPKTNRSEIRDELSLALGVECALLGIDEVEQSLIAADRAETPQLQTGILWTKGIAFEVRGKPCTVNPPSTMRAMFFQISNFAVGVYRRDQLTDSGLAKEDDRAGGWGAVSEDVSKAVGGKWTTRSLEKVRGTVKKARLHVKLGSGHVGRDSVVSK